jgi:hypothetical protein
LDQCGSKASHVVLLALNNVAVFCGPMCTAVI